MKRVASIKRRVVDLLWLAFYFVATAPSTRAALRRERAALPAVSPLFDRAGVSVCGCDPRSALGVLEVLAPGLVTEEALARIRAQFREASDRTPICQPGVRLRWRPLVCTCGDRRYTTDPEGTT